MYLPCFMDFFLVNLRDQSWDPTSTQPLHIFIRARPLWYFFIPFLLKVLCWGNCPLDRWPHTPQTQQDQFKGNYSKKAKKIDYFSTGKKKLSKQVKQLLQLGTHLPGLGSEKNCWFEKKVWVYKERKKKEKKKIAPFFYSSLYISFSDVIVVFLGAELLNESFW